MWRRRILAGIVATVGAVLALAGGTMAAATSYYIADRLLFAWRSGLPFELVQDPFNLVGASFMGLLLGSSGALMLWGALSAMRESRGPDSAPPR
jgi:hypothetical protein